MKFDEPGMVEIACGMVVRLLLPADAGEAQIAALAADMNSKSRTANKTLSQEVNEKVIRSALGERGVDFGSVDSFTLYYAQAAFIGYACVRLRMTKRMDEAALVRLISNGGADCL